MAEFCLDCWNEINERKDPPEMYTYTWRKEICEGCGELKHTIVAPVDSPLLQLVLSVFYKLRK